MDTAYRPHIQKKRFNFRKRAAHIAVFLCMPVNATSALNLWLALTFIKGKLGIILQCVRISAVSWPRLTWPRPKVALCMGRQKSHTPACKKAPPSRFPKSWFPRPPPAQIQPRGPACCSKALVNIVGSILWAVYGPCLAGRKGVGRQR